MARHIYVLDTCVLLHDPHAIYKFEDNDIYIPLAVIDDLDDIKTRKESVAWSAREVFRQLDTFAINDLVTGVKVNEKGGKLFLYNTYAQPDKGTVPIITKVNSDNSLLEVCMELSAKYPKRKVCLVTKDTGLRIRAATLKVLAENYRHDMIDNECFNGYTIFELENDTLISMLYARNEITLIDLVKYIDININELYQNQFIIFKYGSAIHASILKGDKLVNCLAKTEKNSFMGITPRNLEQKLCTYLLNDESIPLVCLTGKAGTGKSLMTLAVALEKINAGIYSKLIVMKPLIPVGGKDIGFLPGDKLSKVSAWLGPIRDNLEQLVSTNNDEKSAPGCFEEMIEEGIIEVEALAFIQGRSIPNAIIMMDEAENITGREARMLVERCGKNSKIILLGDLSQIENPYLDQFSCGLTHAIEGGKFSELVGSIELSKVERSDLAAQATSIFTRRF